MVFVKEKRNRGKMNYYLEHSFRLPNGQVKKISIYLKSYVPKNKKQIIQKHLPVLEKKEKEAFVKYAVKTYPQNKSFTPKIIVKIEEARFEYRKIIKKFTPNQIKDILDRFTINYTYESNALEGNSLTLKEVTLVLQEKIAITGKNLRDIYETRNSRQAVEKIFKNKFQINKKDIQKLHAMVIKDTGVQTGWKKIPNYLYMRQLETTAPEKVDGEMDKLLTWFQKKKKITHPLQLAALFHSKFEQIHPFEDGNGRVGRFLANIILLRFGYPPLIIRKTARGSYFRSLESFDNGSPIKIERFFISKFFETFDKFFKVYVKYA